MTTPWSHSRKTGNTARRVAISGCGLVTAAGNDLDRFWSALMSGRCFIGPVRHFSAPGVDPLLGAEVPSEDLPTGTDPDPQPGRCTQLAIAAVERALADAAQSGTAPKRQQAGIVVGTTLGSERHVARLNDNWLSRGADAVDAALLERVDNHRIAAEIARRHGFGGPVLLTTTACSSGNAAIAWAYDLIASGEADLVLAGGVDTLTRLTYCGFFRMGALSRTVCRPFDRRRDGVSFGEGAGFLVLEELEAARSRGARVYAEVAGYGLSNDAYHVTAPEPSGDGFARAMLQALAVTGTGAKEVDYVSAHGTGTAYNDAAEARAIRAVFKDLTRSIPVSSIKSMIGHTNGAASAIEAIACALAIQHQAVPPTAGLSEPDPECDLHHVPGTGRSQPVDTCLNLSAGFGGLNICVVMKRIRRTGP